MPTIVQRFIFFTGICLFILHCDGGDFKRLHNFGALSQTTGEFPQSPLVQDANGSFYGTTQGSGQDGYGLIYKIRPDGSGFTALKVFTNSADGSLPTGNIALSSNVLYGTTPYNGLFFCGTLFKINTDGTGFTVIHQFDTNALNPIGGVILDGNVLYGTTVYGTTIFGDDGGTVFKINTDGTGYTILHKFTTPEGTILMANVSLSGSTLYGVASSGGAGGGGTIFKVNTDGTGFAKLHDFSTTNENTPFGGVIVSNGVIYGTTSTGGVGGHGVVYKLNADGSGYAVLHNFDDEATGVPYSALTLSGNTLFGTTSSGDVYNGTVFKIKTDGNAFSFLQKMSPVEGRYPMVPLLLVNDTLYGSANGGGLYGLGSLFKMKTTGTGFTNFFNFGDSDGVQPQGHLEISGTTLYGTTAYGSKGFTAGTLFKINTDGTAFTNVFQFNQTTCNPLPTLALSGNVLYGAAFASDSSGSVFEIITNGTGFNSVHDFGIGFGENAQVIVVNDVIYGTTRGNILGPGGTVFKVNTNGTHFMVLHDFSDVVDSTNLDGAMPMGRPLLIGNTLYGTTYHGSPYGYGTVFKVNIDGTGFASIMEFDGANGSHPLTDLVASGETLYGTTSWGGSRELGTVFKINIDGTDFEELHGFNGLDGVYPSGTLAISGSTIYGATGMGGINSISGTVFQINTDGTGFRSRHQFSGLDGEGPWDGVIVSGDTLYGVTASGGDLNRGVAYSLSLAADPDPIPLYSYTNSNNLIFLWSDSAFTLETSPTISGSYSNIPEATSPYTNVMSENARFFRLKRN